MGAVARPARRLAAGVAIATAASVGPVEAQRAPSPPTTAAQAQAYLDAAERHLAELSVRVARTSWVAANFITDDTEILSADVQAEYGRLVQQLATGAAQFDNVPMPPDLRRRFLLLKLTLAAPPATRLGVSR